jgi:hypothetical protein
MDDIAELPVYVAPAPHPGEMDRLLDEMEAWIASTDGADSAAWRVGDFAGGAMIEFKQRAGRRPTTWTVDDLRSLLLEWFPRHAAAEDDVLREVPDGACAFLRFLASRDLLSGDPLPELERAARRWGADFLAACLDPSNWSDAKRRLVADGLYGAAARRSARRSA